MLATAYARDARLRPRLAVRFHSSKDQDSDGRFIPQIGPQDHAWVASVLPPSVFSANEQQCLATGIYFEARGESVKGQAAVAQVILNRVRNPAYPKTICGVVYQNENWRNRCQFSFACDGIKDRVAQPRSITRSPEEVAHGRHRRQDLASRGRLVDPLSRHLCPSALGARPWRR